MSTRCAGHVLVATILALVALAFCGMRGGAADAAPRGKPLSVTYVANMGLLATAGDRTVLIDALFDEPNPDYRAPAPDVLDRMLTATAPFDRVDAVLVTHNHPDHFNERVVLRFLAASRGAVLVAPADAVAAMRSAAANWAGVSPRIVSLDLAPGERATRTVRGVAVTALRTLHSGDRASPMNLMYLVRLGGRTLFHEGDSPGDVGEFERLGLTREHLDVALVHFWFPLSPEQARYLGRDLVPDHVLLGHLPVRLEGDAPTKMDAVRREYKDLLLLLPGTKTRVY